MITYVTSSSTFNLTLSALIQRLPDELHPYIFCELEDPIKVSHVCRAWRKLVLADPSLWNTIVLAHDHRPYSCNNSKILQLYLTRSCTTPLSVDIRKCVIEDFEEDQDCSCLSNLRLVMDHLYRIKELKVHWEPYTEYHGIAYMLHKAFATHRVPILQSLEYSTFDELWYFTNVVCYPNNAPALRKLRLNDAIIDWKSAIFNNLTEVYINIIDRFSSDDEVQWMEIDELFKILRSCPALTILFLRSCFGLDATAGDVVNRTPINLPFLTEITLQELPIGSYLIIVQTIKVPLRTNWYIHDRFPLQESRLLPICDLLKTIAMQKEVSQTRDLTLVLHDSFVSLFSSSYANDDMDSKRKGENNLVISLRLQKQRSLVSGEYLLPRLPFFRKLAQIISAIDTCSNISLFSVQFQECFQINGIESGMECILSGSPMWTAPLLRALPRLEYLKLNLFFDSENADGWIADGFYYYKKGFLEGMTSVLIPSANENVNSKSISPCPHLRSIEIAYGDRYLFEDLIDLLRSRFESGVPIKFLKMTFSERMVRRVTVPDSWLDEARQFVGNVSLEECADKKSWIDGFKPSYAYPRDGSNGLLLGYFGREHF